MLDTLSVSLCENRPPGAILHLIITLSLLFTLVSNVTLHDSVSEVPTYSGSALRDIISTSGGGTKGENNHTYIILFPFIQDIKNLLATDTLAEALSSVGKITYGDSDVTSNMHM